MICGFHNIIDIYSICGNTNRVGFLNVPCLIMRQAAAFDMVGVVGKVNLRLVIDTTFEPCLLLLAQNNEQWHRLTLPRFSTRKLRLGRNAPSLTHEGCTLNLSKGAVITRCALRDAKF